MDDSFGACGYMRPNDVFSSTCSDQTPLVFVRIIAEEI
jgi:hypothetical protein